VLKNSFTAGNAEYAEKNIKLISAIPANSAVYFKLIPAGRIPPKELHFRCLATVGNKFPTVAGLA